MIELEGVSKRYGDKTALYPIDLAVAATSQLALIGTSGCGKSTLLRIVAGLIAPSTGKAIVLGEEMNARSAPRLRRRIGYVIQDGGLFPHLSARDNASLMARHIGWDEAKIGARVSELAELTALDKDLLERFPAELSGGQRQRVGIVRALMLDPELLLLDEPLGALDPLVREKLQTDLSRIVRELNKTVLLVTHDMGEAAFLAREVALMRQGRVVQRGALQDLLENPADPFVESFLKAQQKTWWLA